jgi:alpha-L-arabinofuranosidase
MFSIKRRDFLKQTALAGAACSANSLFRPFAFAQPAATSSAIARVYIDSRRTIAPLDRNLFGSFLEHLGRVIYEGIYDPGSSLSDASGFRKDVMEEVRKIGVPIVRYPGGKIVRAFSTRPGTRSIPTSSAQMNSWRGASSSERSL